MKKYTNIILKVLAGLFIIAVIILIFSDPQSFFEGIKDAIMDISK